jgi:PAS domain-containing protein
MAVRAATDGGASIPPDAPFMDWAFTQSPYALAIHDRNLLCLRVNDRMCQMFGLTEDELRGRRLTDVLPGHQYDAMERYMRQVLEEGKPAPPWISPGPHRNWPTWWCRGSPTWPLST